MELEKLNNIVIKAVPTDRPPNTEKTIRGYDYYPEPYANICFLARKKSGKTNAIYRVLESTLPNFSKKAKNPTKIVIFCSSVNIDDTYKDMITMLKKKNCPVETFEHFIVDGFNILDELVNKLSAKNDKKEEEVKAKKQKKVSAHEAMTKTYNPVLIFGNSTDMYSEKKTDEGAVLTEKPKVKSKKKKDKLLSPEYIIIMDDLSSSMNHKTVSRLLTKNRHMKMKVIIAAHHLNNLDKQGRRMIDYFHVFPNISSEKIQELGEGVGLMDSKDTKTRSRLQDCYTDATQEPYNFLTIDIADGGYRKNFSHRYKD